MTVRTVILPLTGLLVVLSGVSDAPAQPAAANPVSVGHYHLSVQDFDAHKKFWRDTLGGRPGHVVPPDVPGEKPYYVAFPNVLVGLIKGTGRGGTRGSTVDRMSFEVPSLRKTLDRIKAGGYPIVTAAMAPPHASVTGDIGTFPGEKGPVALVMAPGDLLVEFVENPGLTTPIAFHCVHMVAPAGSITAMRDWYLRVFGGTPGAHGATYASIDLAGVKSAIRFSAAVGTLAPATEGRTLGHWGFEVTNLETFAKGLGAKGVTLTRPYMKFGTSNVGFAFTVDPWGTSLEMSEHPSGFFDISRYPGESP